MKSTTALRAARKLIENERYAHVCRAIRCACPGDEGVYTEVWKHIQRSLGDYIVVDCWLQKHVLKFDAWSKNISGREYDTAMREYRLRWIDEMIAQYEAKGD